MRYCELGEARILKRYAKEGLLKPVRRRVVQAQQPESWQSLEEAATRFLSDMKSTCVTAQ